MFTSLLSGSIEETPSVSLAFVMLYTPKLKSAFIATASPNQLKYLKFYYFNIQLVGTYLQVIHQSLMKTFLFNLDFSHGLFWCSEPRFVGAHLALI
jgi:hypothetical protein